MKKIILLLAALLISFSFVNGDIYIKSKTHTDAFKMMGKETPASDIMSEIWMGKNVMATIGKDQSTIINLGEKKMYMIYHAKKQYLEADLPLDISKLIPKEMQPMLKMMKMKLTITPNGETKKVGKWNCKGYDGLLDMGMAKMNMKIWATPDVPFDYKKFTEEMYPVIVQSSGRFLDESSMKEYLKVDGYQVLSEMSMEVMGAKMNVKSEVLEMNGNKAAPAGVYAVPAGYKKIDKMVMKRGM